MSRFASSSCCMAKPPINSAASWVLSGYFRHGVRPRIGFGGLLASAYEMPQERSQCHRSSNVWPGDAAERQRRRSVAPKRTERTRRCAAALIRLQKTTVLLDLTGTKAKTVGARNDSPARPLSPDFCTSIFNRHRPAQRCLCRDFDGYVIEPRSHPQKMPVFRYRCRLWRKTLLCCASCHGVARPRKRVARSAN